MTPTSSSDKAAGQLARLLRYLAADPANKHLRADVFDTALAAGAFDEAQRQVVWALTSDPVDHAWRHRLVLLDMARGEWDEARALLQGLRNEGQSDPALEYNLAYVDFAQGRIEDAQARMLGLGSDALAAQPLALALLLRCQHGAGSPEIAVATFEEFAHRVDAAPPFAAASLAALDAGNAGAAAAWADAALSRDGSQPEALMAKAAVLVAARDSAAALELLGAVLAQRPNDGRALSTAAAAELLAGRVAEAHALFERSASLVPQHLAIWLGLGWSSLFLQDLVGARTAFERALDLDPASGESHGALAVVAAIEGRRDEALASIRRARELDPQAWSARHAQEVLDGQPGDPRSMLARAQAGTVAGLTPAGRALKPRVPPRGNGH
jgi:tetratricopeptide (TPR) repeat protein